MRSKRIATAILAFTALVGCASQFDPKPYSHPPVGQRYQQVSATVLSRVDRTISGTSNNGMVAGAMAGASAGAYTGNSPSEMAGAGLAGALLVGLIGAAIEQNATKIDVTEFLVETENGNQIRIVHARTENFAVGDKVQITYGSPIRMEKSD